MNCPIGITWALIGLKFVTPFYANVSPGIKSMDIGPIFNEDTHALLYNALYYVNGIAIRQLYAYRFGKLK